MLTAGGGSTFKQQGVSRASDSKPGFKAAGPGRRGRSYDRAHEHRTPPAPRLTNHLLAVRLSAALQPRRPGKRLQRPLRPLASPTACRNRGSTTPASNQPPQSSPITSNAQITASTTRPALPRFRPSPLLFCSSMRLMLETGSRRTTALRHLRRQRSRTLVADIDTSAEQPGTNAIPARPPGDEVDAGGALAVTVVPARAWDRLQRTLLSTTQIIHTLLDVVASLRERPHLSPRSTAPGQQRHPAARPHITASRARPPDPTQVNRPPRPTTTGTRTAPPAPAAVPGTPAPPAGRAADPPPAALTAGEPQPPSNSSNGSSTRIFGGTD